MRVFPSLTVLAGVLLGAAGLVLAFTDVAADPPVFRQAAAADSLAAAPQETALPVGSLDRPWHRPAPAVVVRVPEATPSPTPSPEPARPAPNRTSLAFLGKVVTENQSTTYFFKERSSGFVIGLVPGETKSGWTLSLVDDLGYHLEGPGGLYEVPR